MLTSIKTVMLFALIPVLLGCEGHPFLAEGLPSVESESSCHHDVSVGYVPNVRLFRVDDVEWALGRCATPAGMDDVLVLTRTTFASVADDLGAEVAGIQQPQSVERLLIAIPAHTADGVWLAAQELDQEFRVEFEVDPLDGRGFLVSSAWVRGSLRTIETRRDGGLLVEFDLHISPARPFLNEDWRIKGEHMLPRREPIAVAAPLPEQPY